MILVCVLLAIFPFSLQWGPTGHKVIAYIAENLITSTTTQTMQPLLNHSNLTFIAPLPDAFDHTAGGEWNKPYHYVDGHSNTFVPSLDCPKPAQACVYGAVLNYTARLNSSNRPCHPDADPTPQYNPEPCPLEFLTHFVGDMHQPLHVVNIHIFPKGGSQMMVNVTFRKGIAPFVNSIHFVWDTSIILEIVSRFYGDETNWSAWAKVLSAKLAKNGGELYQKYASIVAKGEFVQLCQNILNYSRLNANVYNHTTNVIDEKYFEANWGLVQDLLMKSGARLAWLLDNDLGKKRGWEF